MKDIHFFVLQHIFFVVSHSSQVRNIDLKMVDGSLPPHVKVVHWTRLWTPAWYECICGHQSPFFIFVLSGRRVKGFFHSDASLLVSVAESCCVYSGVSVTCIYEKTTISLKLQHNSTVHVFRTNEQAYMAHWQHWVTDISEHARFTTKNHNLFIKLWHVTITCQHLGPKATFDYHG